MNWKFPQTPNNNLLPWYVMLKNLFALPFMLLAFLFGAGYVACMGIGYFIVKGPMFSWNYVSEQFNDFDLR